MGLFSRKRPAENAPASRPASPTVDWSDPQHVIAEWTGQLESPDQARLGWENGMRLYENDPIPGQRLNYAEYMTRGLAYDLFDKPLVPRELAPETVRRILRLIEAVPEEPAWLAKYAPRIARLGLAVARKHGWQPTTLGGDGQVTDEIMSADREGFVWSAVRSPGVPVEDTMKHFFGT